MCPHTTPKTQIKLNVLEDVSCWYCKWHAVTPEGGGSQFKQHRSRYPRAGSRVWPPRLSMLWILSIQSDLSFLQALYTAAELNQTSCISLDRGLQRLAVGYSTGPGSRALGHRLDIRGKLHPTWPPAIPHWKGGCLIWALCKTCKHPAAWCLLSERTGVLGSFWSPTTRSLAYDHHRLYHEMKFCWIFVLYRCSPFPL